MNWLLITFIIITLTIIALYQITKIKRTQLLKSHTIKFLSSQMNYEVKGNGDPVILVHGSMISDPWNGFDKELSKTHTVYLAHLPGFGGSDVVSGRFHNTDLFSEALCTFIKETKLQNAPVIALSLGTVVAAKSAEKECLQGKLILIGAPIKVDSEILKKASLIPIWLRRFIGSTEWGRSKILVPILRDIIGNKDKGNDQELLRELEITDTKALVDLDVYREVNLQMPEVLPKLKNEIVYIYGEKDKLLKSAKEFLKDMVIIEDADHNIFKSQLSITFEVIVKNL